MDDALFKGSTVLICLGVLSDIDSCEAELIITGNYLILVNKEGVHDQRLAAVNIDRLAGLKAVDIDTAVEVLIGLGPYSLEVVLIGSIRIQSDTCRER